MNRCELCSAELDPANTSGWCAECRLIVSNRIGREERWRDHPDGLHVVSERGRIARLLKVDASHRYPRVSAAGRKRYVHHMLAEAHIGPRPTGLLVLHRDDDPAHAEVSNIRYGSHAENADDRRRNRKPRKENTVRGQTA